MYSKRLSNKKAGTNKGLKYAHHIPSLLVFVICMVLLGASIHM